MYALATVTKNNKTFTKGMGVTHLDVEEPGFERVHLGSPLTEVVHNQVEGPGGKEVGVRTTELLPT